MASAKTFKVTGEFPTGRARMLFKREIRALSAEEALDRVLRELGSRHRVKRRSVKILRLEELPEELGEVGEPAQG